jgi:ABC-2 type transport system ATP-binding protein
MENRMDTFSKGMKQKVLLISGFIHDPQIIFLDEPLAGLDANSVIMMKNIIARLADQGKTIFYCSHMMDVVEKVSNRILLINKGNIIADGPIEELKQRDDESLERIFSNLTDEGDSEKATDAFIETFKE